MRQLPAPRRRPSGAPAPLPPPPRGGTGLSPDPPEPPGTDQEAAGGSPFFAHEEPAVGVDLRRFWDAQCQAWVTWARKPGHDSYWRFARAAFFELLPPAAGLTLDLGCGEGRVARDLRRRGHEVVAVDGSWGMVRAARGADPRLPVVVAEGARLPLRPETVSLVVAYMSLQDIEDMAGAIGEAARVLRPGGSLCLAIVHPVNSAGHFTGVEADAPFVIQGSYFEPRRYLDHIGRNGLEMTFASFHRPLSDYFQALETSGLLVEALREVTEDEASVGVEARRERWRRLPLFLQLRAVKPA